MKPQTENLTGELKCLENVASAIKAVFLVQESTKRKGLNHQRVSEHLHLKPADLACVL